MHSYDVVVGGAGAVTGHLARPRSLGPASRISGVVPAAISILTVWCHRLPPAAVAE